MDAGTIDGSVKGSQADAMFCSDGTVNSILGVAVPSFNLTNFLVPVIEHSSASRVRLFCKYNQHKKIEQIKTNVVSHYHS